ncbi:SAE1 [Bugula neritina]|uniref:SUMO-activating enzyme subunit 1 n=1 Tax=Bugula neritina TaxID=10212 RepID=A0A7J7JPS3_BUGNE|nr:SAE1 [Bugula neritina]
MRRDKNIMSSQAITEDEAALYDRQIRLWGLDAQKRMRASDVLVIGVNGLTGEVMKNIVLAGINSLTILDDAEVTEDHLSAMFVVSSDHLGKKVAEASLNAIRRLNPLVKVTADVSSVKDKDAEFFKQFHIVCMSSVDITLLTRVNDICREHKVKFFCGSVFGFYGFMFSDLGTHEYAEEIKVSKSDTSNGPTAAKQRRLNSSNSKPETETVTVKNTSHFESFKSTLSVDWSTLTPKQLKKTSHIYFITRSLLEFSTKSGHKPKMGDIDKLLAQCTETMTNLKLDPSLLLDKFTPSMACTPEMSPVCAVIGGVLGQEILKAVSQKDAPHNNYFLFNPENNAGIVETIHSKAFLPPAKKSTVVEELIL